jgi:D-alanine-D-alanine ligase-like ATP-grasp enzyme
VNDKFVYAYIREPKDGSYLANLAQGGSLIIVPKEKLPQSLTPAIERISHVFAAFQNKIYAVDFMFDEKGKPWIVELNSMPGLFFTPEEKPYMMEMYEELLEVFKQLLLDE